MGKRVIIMILIFMIGILGGCGFRKEVLAASPLDSWDIDEERAVNIDPIWAQENLVDQGMGELLHYARNFGTEKKLRNADLIWCAWGYFNHYVYDGSQDLLDKNGEMIGIKVDEAMVKEVTKKWFNIEKVIPDPMMIDQLPGSTGVVYDSEEKSYIFSVAKDPDTWTYRVKSCVQYSQGHIEVIYCQTKLGKEENRRDLSHKVGLKKDDNGKYSIISYEVLQ